MKTVLLVTIATLHERVACADLILVHALSSFSGKFDPPARQFWQLDH